MELESMITVKKMPGYYEVQRNDLPSYLLDDPLSVLSAVCETLGIYGICFQYESQEDVSDDDN